MMYAKAVEESVEATPKARANCPGCGATVIAKCGSVNVWHWAHESSEDCDAWSEGETRWHRDWKERFPKECREVVVGPHRADVLQDMRVFEFQTKPLSTEQMLEREGHYRKLGYRYLWVFNALDAWQRFGLRKKMGNGHWGFRWYHGWQRLIGIATPFALDFGEDGMFMVKKIGHEWGKTFGYGMMMVRHLDRPDVFCGRCKRKQEPGEDFSCRDPESDVTVHVCKECYYQ